ncbi:MAG: translation initiation factor IF-2 subunit gamma [Thermoplasmata archaeon]|nr:MAG: translation initiation factor IF-2 subunit gamma [Thermoplasmata archaeon]
MKVQHQPEINIGLVGHVDHGKTTLTEALSGQWTDTHSEEVKRGISIRLGYADTSFYKCPDCGEPECYTTKKKCPHCGEKTEYLRSVSFVDSPGHETLMATMLSGTALMNGSLLLIAANEKCPQPQTKEHLMGLSIANVNNIIIIQNKIDLISEAKAKENHGQIQNFLSEMWNKDVPIIPISAHHDANIDFLIYAIEKLFPTPEFDGKIDPLMYVARSFDVNKPGARPKDIQGGILGGSLISGELKQSDKIEIKPGRKIEERGKIRYEELITEITSLIAGGKTQKKVKPGGLIGIGTMLDPAISKSDSLIGSVVGLPGTLPPVWNSITIENHLLDFVVGTEEAIKVENIKTGEPIMLNVGAATTVGIVTSAREDIVEMNLKLPVCAKPGQRIAISRRVGTRWRLIGYGIIK